MSGAAPGAGAVRALARAVLCGVMPTRSRDAVRMMVAGVSLSVAALLGIGCRADPDVTSGEALEPPSRPNIIWIVADSIGADIEQQLQASSDGATLVAPLDTVSADGASVRSALLTGVHPEVLRPVPPAGVIVVPVQLRRGGYYTSRAGDAHHNLAFTASHPLTIAAGADTDAHAALTRPGLLGAWDAAGRDVDWRDKSKDWDSPCTVSFGCGGSGSNDPSFFALFNLGADADVEDEVGSILAALVADGLAGQTAVFALGVGAGEGTLAVRWPSGWEPADSRGDELSVLDLAPTALALAGLPVPPHLAGRPLVPLVDLDVVEPSRRDVAVMSHGHDQDQRASAVSRVAATPAGYPTGGLFHVAPRVELSCDTPGSTIVYTTEREPPFYWRLYRGPFRMRFWELRFQCGRLGYQDSSIVTYEFDIE